MPPMIHRLSSGLKRRGGVCQRLLYARQHGYVEKMLGDDWDDDLSVKHRLLEISKRFKTPA